jgi:hypothetical protein
MLKLIGHPHPGYPACRAGKKLAYKLLLRQISLIVCLVKLNLSTASRAVNGHVVTERLDGAIPFYIYSTLTPSYSSVYTSSVIRSI